MTETRVPITPKAGHREIMLFALLTVSGFFANYFAPQLFTGFHYFSGSIAIMLVMLLFSPLWWPAATAVALSSVFFHPGHEHTLIWLMAESCFTGWMVYRGRSRNIILYTALYWLTIGAPLMFAVLMQNRGGDTDIMAIMMLNWTAGIINSVICSLLFAYLPFTKFLDRSDEPQSIPIHQLIFNLMMATAIAPTIIILATAINRTTAHIPGAAQAQASPYPDGFAMTLLALLCLNMVALAGSLYTSRRLAAPLRQLTRITTDLPDQLMRGKSTPWPESMVQEIDQLSCNFRVMATALSYKFQEITWYSETLEARVRERTRELTKANSQLRKEIAGHKATEKHRNQLMMELENKNKELEGIVYVASHDLRSPLVNIQGFSQKLASGCEEVGRLTDGMDMPPEKRQKLEKILYVNIPRYIGFITGSTDKMGLLIKGLLRLSRLGQASLCLDNLDMKALIENIVSSMTFQIDSAKAVFTVEELHPCRSDAGQVTQIFSNLLDNAIKFASPQRPLTVRIFSEEFDDGIRYCVEDNGIGISAAHKDRIWEIFHRLDPEATTGEGMGLTLARQIVSRLGGSIWVESQPDMGSWFYVVLPKVHPAE